MVESDVGAVPFDASFVDEVLSPPPLAVSLCGPGPSDWRTGVELGKAGPATTAVTCGCGFATGPSPDGGAAGAGPVVGCEAAELSEMLTDGVGVFDGASGTLADCATAGVRLAFAGAEAVFVWSPDPVGCEIDEAAEGTGWPTAAVICDCGFPVGAMLAGTAAEFALAVSCDVTPPSGVLTDGVAAWPDVTRKLAGCETAGAGVALAAGATLLIWALDPLDCEIGVGVDGAG